MNAPSSISQLAKAADIAKSFTSEVLRNAPLILAMFAASLFLAVAPQPFLPANVAEYRWLFTCIGVFTGSYFTLLLWFARRSLRNLKRHCRELSTDEQELLSAYLKENKASEAFFAFHPPLCSLIAKGILTFASGTFPVDDAPVMIQPAAMRYLRKHPHLIGLKTSEIGTDKPSE